MPVAYILFVLITNNYPNTTTLTTQDFIDGPGCRAAITALRSRQETFDKHAGKFEAWCVEK